MVFAVRRDLSNVRVAFYLKEVIVNLSLKLFFFNLILFLFLALISFGLIYFNVSLLIVGLILLIVSLSFMFVPQAIIVEEKPLIDSIKENFYFIEKNFIVFIQVIVLGLILTACIPLIEFAIDLIDPSLFIGRFISLLFSLIFVLPFMETAKTFFYMMKFDLIRKTELLT
jgi:hypothetical protein